MAKGTIVTQDKTPDNATVKVTNATSDVVHELHTAIESHGWFNSRHEGWGVIHEEWLELRETIMKDLPPEDIYMEAIQLSAMALEFAIQYGTKS